MPRFMAPRRPANSLFASRSHFLVVLPSGTCNKSLYIDDREGTPTHTVEVIGEPNRLANIRLSQYNGNAKSSEKSGEVPKDDVNELMTLLSTCRGFPSHPSKDVYGYDTKLEFNTFEIQWSNEDEDSAANEVNEIGGETKDDFKRVADSIEALARTFAKQDSAI